MEPSYGLGVFLTQEYKYNPVRTRNSSTARGPQLRDVASLEVGVCSSVGIQWELPFSSVGRVLGHSN